MKRIFFKVIVISAWLSSGVCAGTIITATQIKNAVEEFVVSQVESEIPANASLEIDVRWQNNIELDVDVDPVIRVRKSSSRQLRGPSVLRVGVDLDGETLRKMSVTADIRLHLPVLVAPYSIKRGENIESTRFEMVKRDVTKLRGVYYTDQNELVGMRMGRSLGAGEILTDLHVERIPIVKRGEIIRIISRGRVVQVAIDGTAMQDGGKGDLIRVKNVDSGKIVRGHVVESGLVEVGL